MESKALAEPNELVTAVRLRGLYLTLIDYANVKTGIMSRGYYKNPHAVITALNVYYPTPMGYSWYVSTHYRKQRAGKFKVDLVQYSNAGARTQTIDSCGLSHYGMPMVLL